MKKLFLSFAALVAIVSCVEEKGLEPQQPVSGNQLTIKAVAAETKTALSDGDVKDGVSVLWLDGDAIKVVFKGADKYYESKFTTSLSISSDKADFTGTLDPEVTTANCGNYGYAIYPYHEQLHPDSQDKIVLPVLTDQDGIVKTPTEDFFEEEIKQVIQGNQTVEVKEWHQKQNANYSYATVSLDNLKAGNTTEAYFRNVLSLIRINIPSGVRKVTISSVNTNEDAEYEDEKNYFPLTGKAKFQYDHNTKKLVMLVDEWNEQDKSYQVVLKNANDSELDPMKVYDLLVYPGTHAKLTIKVEGTDVSCTKTINKEYKFDPSECYTLDLREIFAMGSKEVYAFPDGKPFEIPVTTTFDNITVDIPADASWLTVTPAAKGVLRNDVISLTAAENTDAERSAIVTLKSGSTILSTVKVNQKAYVKELINEYAETYGSTNGTLKIEVSDDQSKGVYKVTICGHTLYADFSGNTLTVHDGNNDKTLSVSADYKSITATGLTIKDVSDVDYSAVLLMGEAELTAEEEALLGNYDETWTYKDSPYNVKQGMKIEKSDEAVFGEFKIKCLSVDANYFEGYGDLSDDGTKITVKIGKQYHKIFNSIGGNRIEDLHQLEFTVNKNEKTLSFNSWTDGSGNKVTEYEATKVGDIEEDGEQGGEEEQSSPLTALVGTWNETFSYFQGWGDPVAQTGVVTVTLEGDKLRFTNMFNTSQWGNTKSGNYYGVLSDDGKNILISDVDNTNPHGTYGPIVDSSYSPTTLSLAIGNNQITIASAFNGMLLNYTATKQIQ